MAYDTGRGVTVQSTGGPLAGLAFAPCPLGPAPSDMFFGPVIAGVVCGSRVATRPGRSALRMINEMVSEKKVSNVDLLFNDVRSRNGDGYGYYTK